MGIVLGAPIVLNTLSARQCDARAVQGISVNGATKRESTGTEGEEKEEKRKEKEGGPPREAEKSEKSKRAEKNKCPKETSPRISVRVQPWPVRFCIAT
jgi:hypothetical protein